MRLRRKKKETIADQAEEIIKKALKVDDCPNPKICSRGCHCPTCDHHIPGVDLFLVTRCSVCNEYLGD